MANSLAGMRDILIDPGLCGWPEERVTVLQDPEDIRTFVPRLRELVETTPDVLFLYFAGHGIILPDGQLCLTLTDTNPSEADSTALTFHKVRQLLLGSPARVKAVVLDSCNSGRAVNTMADPSAGTTDIEGAYTLAASDGAAHVVPLAEQAGTATSFTRELIELVRTGVPGAPEWLTFGALYPHLQFRLLSSGLPRPRQGSTDTADRFPFTRNVAQYVGSQVIEQYGLAMTAAFASGQKRGLTETRLAQALFLSGEAVAGYLSGRRIAPVEVLHDFFDCLDEHGCGLDHAAQQRIMDLRDAADTAVAHDPREIAALQRVNREQEAEIRALRSAWERERTEHARATVEAEQELARLKGTVDEQGRQLSHAAGYTRALEAELTEIRREADEVSRELRVLRSQLTRLTDPPVASVPDEAAQSLTARLQAPAATRSTTSGTAVAAPFPVAAPAPRPAQPRYAARPQPKRTWKARLRIAARTGNTSAAVRSTAMLLSLLLLSAAVATFAAAYIQHFAYTRLASCTKDQISRADTTNCLTQQAGTATDRAVESDQDTSTYTVTFTTAGGKQETWNVGQAFHDGTPAGTHLTLNSYHGTIVTITHGTLAADLDDNTAFLSSEQMVAPFLLMGAVTIPLVLTGDRFFISVTIFLAPFTAVWSLIASFFIFSPWHPAHWTTTTTAVAHALIWALICVPPIAMAAAD
ncbi:hypothetical protein WN71_008440 [Streptomyces mangrovisoli]|uniref:Peptidase C14 caspase domain-containing protein n=1 Tax=Streptomyces mangrovisoli TaxID=1428628 RepID=A0A1J4P4N6_9ACTN|nr:hypothetical protein WN71_008440 [Streptomyces mangrovisoli]